MVTSSPIFSSPFPLSLSYFSFSSLYVPQKFPFQKIMKFVRFVPNKTTHSKTFSIPKCFPSFLLKKNLLDVQPWFVWNEIEWNLLDEFRSQVTIHTTWLLVQVGGTRHLIFNPISFSTCSCFSFLSISLSPSPSIHSFHSIFITVTGHNKYIFTFLK